MLILCTFLCYLSVIPYPSISRDNRSDSFVGKIGSPRGATSDVTYNTSHPRFIVFPAPRGLASVNLAHSSSFLLFSSDLASPNAVPSCSASIVSCSDDVGFAADCGLGCVSLYQAIV